MGLINGLGNEIEIMEVGLLGKRKKRKERNSKSGLGFEMDLRVLGLVLME